MSLSFCVGVIGHPWSERKVRADIGLAISVLALVLWLVGAFVACLGKNIARSYAFPMFFLLWLAPIPEFVLVRVVSLLQQDSAACAHLLFAISGVPVFQQGTVLSISGLTIEVAAQCSSIRSSSILMVSALVLGYLFVSSLWGRVIIAVAAALLAIVKNGLRIYVLGMLATHVDPSILSGRLHHQGGVIFFLWSMFFLAIVIWMVLQLETRACFINSASA